MAMLEIGGGVGWRTGTTHLAECRLNQRERGRERGASEESRVGVVVCCVDPLRVFLHIPQPSSKAPLVCNDPREALWGLNVPWPPLSPLTLLNRLFNFFTIFGFERPLPASRRKFLGFFWRADHLPGFGSSGRVGGELVRLLSLPGCPLWPPQDENWAFSKAGKYLPEIPHFHNIFHSPVVLM